MLLDASLKCRHISLGVIIEAIEVVFFDDGEVGPGVQFSGANVMAPENGRSRHRESRMVRRESRLLQDQQFSALAANILKAQDIQGAMQSIILLMKIVLSRRDFDDLVVFSVSLRDQSDFFSMLKLWERVAGWTQP